MSVFPVSQLMGVGAKLATCAGCGYAVHLIERPVLGILAGALVLLPLASCLEDLFQLPDGFKRSSRSQRPASRSAARSYPKAPNLAHHGLAR